MFYRIKVMRLERNWEGWEGGDWPVFEERFSTYESPKESRILTAFINLRNAYLENRRDGWVKLYKVEGKEETLIDSYPERD